MKIIEAFKRTLKNMREREVKVDTKKMEEVVDKLEPHKCHPGCSCADAIEGEIWENAP